MSKILTEYDIVREHTKTYEQKSRDNFKWLETIADYYDYGVEIDPEYANNIDLNSNLFKGIGVTHQDIASFIRSSKTGSDIELSAETIPHMDIVGPIANSIDGIQRNRPFLPVVIDTGPMEGNMRRDKYLSLIRNYFQQIVVPQFTQEATMSVFKKYGIENPMDLDPDEQMQMQQEIQALAEEITPERIDSYMSRDYMSPRTEQLTGLIQTLTQEYDLKSVTDDGFQMSLASGVEIYYQGIRGGQLVFEMVNPKNFVCGDYDSNRWIQHSPWAVRREELPVIEILKRWGDQMNTRETNRVIRGVSDWRERDRYENQRLVGVIGDDSELDGIDLRTLEGQWDYRSLKRKYGIGVRDNSLEVKHIVVQSLDTVKAVKRIVDGKPRLFYVGRNYEINKLKGDICVHDKMVPMIMEVTKIETGGKPIYVQKGEIPYSIKSLEDPFSAELPYIGSYYNKMHGNGRIVSQIDLGKSGQYRYNITYHKMQKQEDQDLGRVLHLVLSLKPSNYETEDWLRMIRQDGLLLSGEENSPTGQVDPSVYQAIRSIDLSGDDKIASYIQKLDIIKRDTAESMRYNSAMLGQGSPYESIANRQVNLQLSTNQTKSIYDTHDQIVEKALAAFLHTSLVYFKDKPLKRSWIMSDMSISSMELDPDLLRSSEIGVYLSMSTQDIQDTESLKTEAQALIQGGQIDFEEWTRIKTAKSMVEILNVAKKASRRRDAMIRQQQEAAAAAAKEEQEFKIALKQMELDALREGKRIDQETSLRTADLRADQFRRGFDVDNNKVNDANQRHEKELEYKKSKDAKDYDIKLRELELLKSKIEADKAKTRQKKT